MADLLYPKGVEQAFLKIMDLESDTMKLAFMATTYTAVVTENFYSDISASLASGSTLQTLANFDVVIDTSNARVEFNFDDVVHSAATFVSDKVVIFDAQTAVDATSPLIACIDLSATVSPVGDTTTITVNAEGAFAITTT